MKFKKQICVFLAFFLLVSNTGYSFNIHFCGYEIASISLKSNFINENSIDECCGIAEQNTNCCNDKVFQFHKNIEQVIVKSFSTQFEYCILKQDFQPLTFAVLPDLKSETTSAYYCDANAPPLFKLYQQYIFYDSI